jgi:shikimate 5-dehydrogenase
MILFLFSPEKAVSLASAVGGQPLRLFELETFKPEEGMILANATSLGMYPNVDSTPIPKVFHPFPLFCMSSACHVIKNLQEQEKL